VAKDFRQVIRNMAAIFTPGRFSVVLAASRADACNAFLIETEKAVAGYQRLSQSDCEPQSGYHITFISYKRTMT